MKKRSASFSFTLKRMRPDIEFIIGRDHEQLLPANDRLKICDYDNSSALQELIDGNRLELTTCRRYDKDVYTTRFKGSIIAITSKR